MPAASLIARALPALALAALSAACVAIPDAPIVDGPSPQVAGTAVGLGQPVWVGKLVATPAGVIEDSRCPMNARCVWAGRLVVNTRIDGAGWRQTAPLTLGEPYAIKGTTITLTSGTPDKMAGEGGATQADHFTYEGGN